MAQGESIPRAMTPLRFLGLSAGALSIAALCSADAQPAPAGIVPVQVIQNWLDQKDSWGPAYTAGPGWKKFMGFMHREMQSLGMKVTDLPYPYTRWYTTEFPDKSGWSLVSNGAPVEVASYGTQSGSTGPMGVTAPMILYDLNLPADRRPPLSALAGKILVIKQQPYETLGTPRRIPLGVPAPHASGFCGNPPLCKAPAAAEPPPSPQWGNAGAQDSYKDYEYRSDRDGFPTALFEKTPVSVEASFRNRDQFGQIRPVITDVLIPSGAVAAVTVMDLSPLAAAGARIHPTPRQFNVPLLMLDRVAGTKVVRDAATGKMATLILDAHEEEHANAYETVATLPGRNYGTPEDQAILLATHVDGPSIIEDDGALGILALLRHYAAIPQDQRPKSIVVYLESRHFVPGTEASYPFDAVKDHPELFRTVVGGLALEHFGGLQFAQNGDIYAPTGKAATTYIWGWPNPFAIAEATAAIKEQELPRAINAVPARPGVNGRPQQPWLGGGFSRYLVDLGGWPGWHISGDWPSAGFQAYYPAAKTRVSAGLFQRQAATALQLADVLMTKDVIALAPLWAHFGAGERGDEFGDDAFLNADGERKIAEDRREILLNVRDGNYDHVVPALHSLAADATRLMTAAAAEKMNGFVTEATTWAERGIAWKQQGLLAPAYGQTPPGH
jgi:hypothetical protein